jgi:adenylate kinase
MPRVIVHGQTGLSKTAYLQEVQAHSRANASEFRLLSIGDLLYEEDQSIPLGNILNLDLPRLLTLRKNVDRRILEETRNSTDTIVVNSHAVFRAQRGLIYAGGLDLLRGFGQDLYITVIDSADAVYFRMQRDYPFWGITLKDILVWREEEILVTEVLASLSRPPSPHYVVARNHPPSVIHDLIFHRQKRKAYVSFPITLVQAMPDVREQVDRFRAEVAKRLIAFDPLTISERRLVTLAANARSLDDAIRVETLGGELAFPARELLALKPDIDSQIVARDFKLIDQSDMVIAFIPRVAGRIEVSAGVTMEIQHAFETGKEVYIICPHPQDLSPFFTEHARAVFLDFDSALGQLT